jgi:hypothetical protein
MCCLSFFINKKMLGKQLCVGMCLKCLMVATPLPNVEYASSAWDPYQENQIKKIEMVQRRSARFIKHQYRHRNTYVTFNIIFALHLVFT